MYVGGILGRNEGSKGKIEKCYNTGNISCFYEYSKTYGGIVGTGNIPIDQCYNIGTIKSVSENTELGGIAGVANKSITNSYNLGKLEVEGNRSLAVGGIVGRVSSSEASLENCYNVGEIKYKENITSSYIGGICGEGSNIKNVYSIGKLENTLNDSMIGAIIGNIGQSAEKIYYLKGVYSTALGSTNTSVTAEEIETLEKMKAKLNSNLATLEGWKEVNNGYPILSWQ
mgnify:FL=1